MGWLDSATPYIADALVIFGVGIMTAGVLGLIRMPDIYTKVHAASKSVLLGAIVLALSSFVTGDTDIVYRVILISAALLLTTPVASHVIAHAAAIEGERMEAPGAFDESAYHLDKEPELRRRWQNVRPIRKLIDRDQRTVAHRKPIRDTGE